MRQKKKEEDLSKNQIRFVGLISIMMGSSSRAVSCKGSVFSATPIKGSWRKNSFSSDWCSLFPPAPAAYCESACVYTSKVKEPSSPLPCHLFHPSWWITWRASKSKYHCRKYFHLGCSNFVRNFQFNQSVEELFSISFRFTVGSIVFAIKLVYSRKTSIKNLADNIIDVAK